MIGNREIKSDGRMPHKVTQNGQTYYLGYDQIGTLRAVSKEDGTIVKRVNEYDTYGNVLSDSNETLKVPFGFAGGLYDPDTKLTRFGYRDYDAGTGKWTAKDPIGFDGGDTNLYGYVLQDQVDLTDTTGLSQADISKINDALVQYVNNLNALGYRCNNCSGNVNNLLSHVYGYWGCIDQAEGLIFFLSQLNLDDDWSFYKNHPSFWHTNVFAMSNNQTDPILIIDPWRFTITIGILP